MVIAITSWVAVMIVHDEAGLTHYITNAVQVSGDNPVLIDSYLRDAIEVDVDAIRGVADDVHIAGIMEHIEEAGIRSGGQLFASAYSYPILFWVNKPPTAKLARGLGVVGLMNVQYAIKDGTVYILEVNPRASRRFPSSPRRPACRSPRSRPRNGGRLVDLLKTYPAETLVIISRSRKPCSRSGSPESTSF